METTTSGQPPIFDGHNDTLAHLHLPMRGGGRSFFARGERGQLDLPRAREGGFAGGFFAINAPPDLSGQMQPASDFTRTAAGYEMRLASAIDPVFALRFTLGVMSLALRVERESAGQVRIVRTADEVDACLRDGVLAIALLTEGAEALDTELEALDVLHAAGLRGVGPVWSRPNRFGEGVPFAYPRSPDTGPGLTDAGRRLVAACNRLGVLLDLAHITERGFWDVAELTDAPLVVSHAAVHAICPSTRNLTDRQLDAIGESDGLVGIMFDVSNLRPDGDLNRDTPLDVIVQHARYVADRIGVAHVALGSDFDGADMPDALGDVTGLPRLLTALRAGGFGEDELRLIANENWLRVLRATWK